MSLYNYLSQRKRLHRSNNRHLLVSNIMHTAPVEASHTMAEVLFALRSSMLVQHDSNLKKIPQI